MAVSAVIQSAARLERGRTLNNVVIIHGSGWTQLDQIWHAGGREGGRGGRGGEGREGRGGEGKRRGGGRAGEGRRGLSTLSTNHNLVTAEPSRPPAKRVTG